MPRKFFADSETKLLINKIKGIISQANELNPANLKAQLIIKECSEQLTQIISLKEYSKIPPELKREIRRTIKKLDHQSNQVIVPKAQAPQPPLFTIQIPSPNDLAQMRGMTAGGEEDQSQRLMHMVQKIKEVQLFHPYSPIVTSDQINLQQYWIQLFDAINRGVKEEAFYLLYKIPLNDQILKALGAVHSVEYLKKIITYSIDAKSTGKIRLNRDILITPKTFELLIKDIAATFDCPSKLCFSFGLPSHHAYSDEGSGFCIINKTALLIRHAEMTHPEPLKYIIVGTDVNRDNGLCSILMQSASHLDLCHVDVFDSRVYPQQNLNNINNELQIIGQGEDIKCWRKDKLTYFAIDLSVTTRPTDSIHPALLFALRKIEETIEIAKKNQQKTAIFLPSGWDSHENETAFCGKCVNGKMLTQTAAHECRFNDNDFKYFYSHLLDLYQQNKDIIIGLYWGLEGGYDRIMYEGQIQLLLDTMNKQFMMQDQNEPPFYSHH